MSLVRSALDFQSRHLSLTLDRSLFSFPLDLCISAIIYQVLPASKNMAMRDYPLPSFSSSDILSTFLKSPPSLPLSVCIDSEFNSSCARRWGALGPDSDRHPRFWRCGGQQPMVYYTVSHSAPICTREYFCEQSMPCLLKARKQFTSPGKKYLFHVRV